MSCCSAASESSSLIIGILDAVNDSQLRNEKRNSVSKMESSYPIDGEDVSIFLNRVIIAFLEFQVGFPALAVGKTLAE